MYIVCGEIKAKISYADSEKMYYKQDILIETGNKEKKFQIKFNNFQINFYKTLSKFKIYDTIYSEQNIQIFSNFYLPVSVGKIVNLEQKKEVREYSKEEAEDIAKEKLSKKIEKLIKNKENIIRNQRK